MRFLADGPSIPDELLLARDAGQVIFFCGAGVSQAEAQLPDFIKLAKAVISSLGSTSQSPARLLLDKAIETGRMDGVGGLLATDRIFGLLAREFEVSELRAAVAEAISPSASASLEAHKTLLDLSTTRAGVTRLVTTNFDLLFERSNPNLAVWSPPHLPDPRNEKEFRGIIHLHGRVNAEYTGPHSDEFVISSADFGRAYLSDGWAVRFIQNLLSHYQIVFIGYTADDPPVQYLLEALNLGAGTKKKLYAFQEGDESRATALWEHRGVQAIPFGNAGFAPLWTTLRAWAERAKDTTKWYYDAIRDGDRGPANVHEHFRGQIAHIMSTREGAKRAALSDNTLSAAWLLTFDAEQRYLSPVQKEPYGSKEDLVDPFDSLGLDSDIPPERNYSHREQQRKPPDKAWDIFAPSRLDFEEAIDQPRMVSHRERSWIGNTLPPRLDWIGKWIYGIAHEPLTLWWAAQQPNLHQDITHYIEVALQREPDRFSNEMRREWRFLLAAWKDIRPNPDMRVHALEAQVKVEGWGPSLIRELFALYRPRLKVEIPFDVPHPLVWVSGPPETIVRPTICYPKPHTTLDIPDSYARLGVAQIRAHIELAISLQKDISEEPYFYLTTTRPDDGENLPESPYGAASLIVLMQKLLRQFANSDQRGAKAEITSWPIDDEYIFARLRIWAASSTLLSPDEAADIFLSLPDTVFWGSKHQRDLLFAIRDRWSSLPNRKRSDLETRFLSGSFPWKDTVPGGPVQAATHHRLSRLHWLSKAGVRFSFEWQKKIAALQKLAPDWRIESGEGAADSDIPTVHGVTVDKNPTALLNTPIRDLLTTAEQLSRINFQKYVESKPLQGLSEERPARVLAALTHAARNQKTPYWAWSSFLHADRRETDSTRMIYAIATQLVRLPLSVLNEFSYLISGWMERIADRLYGDSARVLDSLWERMIQALATSDAKTDYVPEHGWSDQAINSPIGRLFDLLLSDPAFRISITPHHSQALRRLNQLLSLPGNKRGHAIVMASRRVNWLHRIDPSWTEHNLLKLSARSDSDGDAFWDGVFWGPEILIPEVFSKVKADFINRAIRPKLHQRHNIIAASLLLARWNPEEIGGASDQSLSNVELRDVIVAGNDELRGQILWHLRRWMSEDRELWYPRILPFFKNVWPKQRALRTSTTSGKLANFILESDELMPTLVALLSPRLVPILNDSIHLPIVRDGNVYSRVIRYPLAMLELLWAVLPEDTKHWPDSAENVLNFLAECPETSADARLGELRRRREE